MTTRFEDNNVVKPHENHRGLPMSDWIGQWTNWLFSANPYHDPTTDVLFMRTFIGYNPSQDSIQRIYERPYGGQEKEKDFERVVQARAINNRLERRDGTPLGEVIDDGTTIFMPILISMSWVGEDYNGKVLGTEEELRDVGRRVTDESRQIWASYREVGENGVPKNWQNMVTNLVDYKFESSLFKLYVSEKSPFLDNLGVSPGIYDAITVGYFLLIKPLGLNDAQRTKGLTYDFHFGGRGKVDYQTDAIYRVTVKYKHRSLVADVSPGREPVAVFGYPKSVGPSVDALKAR